MGGNTLTVHQLDSLPTELPRSTQSTFFSLPSSESAERLANDRIDPPVQTQAQHQFYLYHQLFILLIIITDLHVFFLRHE